MKTNSINTRITVSLCTFVFSFSVGWSGLSDCEFERAVKNKSTSPSLVLVKIGDSSGAVREACITANFLRGAIMTEYNLPSTKEGLLKGEEIVLRNPSMVFRFKKAAAFSNVQPRYDSSQLARVYSELGAVPVERLKSRIGSVCQRDLRDACGHFLLQKGIPVRVADLTGWLVADWSDEDCHVAEKKK